MQHEKQGVAAPLKSAGVFLGVAIALAAPIATAQTVPWRAVIGSNSTVVVPGLPSGMRNYTDVYLSEAGAGRIGVRMSSPAASAGYWAYQQGAWSQYMKANVTGALGPGRTGGESAHVFLDYDTGLGTTGYDGQRFFVAKAGNPADTVNATRGVWRWDLAKNVEMARVLTDGALGPGMGADWFYANNVSFDVLPMTAGGALIEADVTSPTGQVNRLIVKSVAGQGNVPCWLEASTTRSLAPNLAAGDYFSSFQNYADYVSLAVTPAGRVYGKFIASNGYGIWEICNGAPRPIAVTGRTGALGPDIGSPTSTFRSDLSDSGFSPVLPGEEGNIYFGGNYFTATGAIQSGLFWNDGATNRPLAINDAAGAYGPHWQDATWRSFNSATAAGRWIAFLAQVQTGDGGTPSGLWRAGPGVAPQLVALFNLPGTYGPETGRTWVQFYAMAVLGNGDILVSARTNPNAEDALWLLKRGAAPRRILIAGQSVTIPTAAGDVADTVTSYTLDGIPYYAGGDDAWAGADGGVLVRVNTSSHGSVYVTAVPSNPVDVIFRNGFEH